MRRIAHISDLHFGAHDPEVAEGLLADLARQSPHLIAVSGDLTQRARKGEFHAARAFLDRMTAPQLIVPGNHDVPLYNVLHRVFRPLAGYRQIVTADMEPFYQDDEMAVAGVNTARARAWKEGRISPSQIARMKARFEAVPPHLFKAIVSHHPFIPPRPERRSAMVGRALVALKVLEACGCSLILTGHLHRAFSADVRPYHLEINRSILVAEAGTAISHRKRNEPNTYNQITIHGDIVDLEVRAWDGRQFDVAVATRFQRREEEWVATRPGPE